jgi:hypothetical protein
MIAGSLYLSCVSISNSREANDCTEYSNVNYGHTVGNSCTTANPRICRVVRLARAAGDDVVDRGGARVKSSACFPIFRRRKTSTY